MSTVTSSELIATITDQRHEILSPPGIDSYHSRHQQYLSGSLSKKQAHTNQLYSPVSDPTVNAGGSSAGYR